ncbi:Polyketide synthase-nonribosomal peptide synthetase 2 [Seiridium cupressi]
MTGRSNEPIAIVGSACRFAGDASSPSKLWELLREPRDVRSEIPDSRFSAKGFYHPDNAYHGRSNVTHSYLIDEDLSLFDAEFFGIRPVEAKAIDPQQRCLMEAVYEGIEAAGLTIDSLRGSDTSVYVGVMCSDYKSLQLRDLQETPTYFATGTGESILSNRISYFFDWRGPSITVDTACSSSLVAVHMAVQTLRAGDSRTALACGSNLILGPENYIIESKLKMLSPDGVCRMWDRDANGYARGDGVAAVVLKTLSAALEDGDHIECIIRETGLNQDGATPGITMPSASAQEALIRSTYAKAGLDLQVPEDRPQYFEAHGTGTPAGDPIEAEAISKAFFGNATSTKTQGEPLYVGSIKTVLGHTEGTAGVAAVLKASLALQDSQIPPNLLFENLSDNVAPFYKNLEIVKAAKPWPKLHGSVTTRRASVNSFGFGGANAHAVLESYDNTKTKQSTPKSKDQTIFTPFIFSAMSEQSLRASLDQYSTYLQNNPIVDPHDLAWTLRQRRSEFAFRTSFSAQSMEDLQSQIATRLQDTNDKVATRALATSKGPKIKVLGVFTGQGAQYARMGAELIEKSSTARRIVQDLGSYLASLPGKDRPRWSLEAEILAESASSRVGEASISQPLCTAVQILLVDLLRLANFELDCVVGHSSGEIGTAYAAGVLTARDAMYVAYYRGLHLQLASSPNGKDIPGAMIAVGTSMEDAAELCEEFSGRISVAASNSSSSVTISGDEDAIAELQVILDDEKKFNRRLKVDKAYHSSHMLPCYDTYVESLRQCGVKAKKLTGKCVWISSVFNKSLDSDSLEAGLSDIYWAENMTKPVLFSQALSTALSTVSCGLAVEVGPHPALKGPATQTIQEALNNGIPYQGLLSRQDGAVGTLSAGLGFLWQYLGKSAVALDSFEQAVTSNTAVYKIVKGLPTYQWNHNVKHWHESRRSRKMRLRKEAAHSLLGDESTDSGAHHRSWRNLLRNAEIDWLSGHQVQGQTVFPAAGYVSTALEAAKHLAEGKNIRLIDVSNFTIHQAVVFDQDDAGIEVLIALSEINRTDSSRIRAKFTYSAAMGSQGDDLTLAASGDVEVLLGSPSPDLLPKRAPKPAYTIDVNSDRFYSALARLGYNFSGRFRSLTSMSRKHEKSTCMVGIKQKKQGDEQLLIHPAELDASFQSVILAYSYPDDDQLRSLHLPTNIGRIRVNPALCQLMGKDDELVPVDAALTPGVSTATGFSGDINLYSNNGSAAAIQVQAVKLVPLGGSAVDDDRKVFSKIEWVNSVPDAVAAASDTVVTQTDRDILMALERISTYYLKEFDRGVPKDDPVRSERPYSCYLDYARHFISLVESGKHRLAKREWMNDTLQTVLKATEQYSNIIDVKVMHLVGETMPKAFRKETTMLENFRTTGLLDDYYVEGFGLGQSSLWIAKTVAQLTARYPNLNILEVGAGTGGATKNIFRAIGNSFLSYTFTDISAGFFGNAASIFAEQKDRMGFKTFDAERDPADQGFIAGTYDVIVASFVIHATAELERTMRNIRKLLRPGGFLVVGEGSHTSDPGCFIFGPLPGWWLGYDEGRTLSPHASPEGWDQVLRATGFSGIDTIAPDDFQHVLGVSLFVSQAVDDKVTLLREPLSAPPQLGNQPIERLVVVGGSTRRSARLVESTKSILTKHAVETHVFKTLEDIDFSILGPETTVLSLTDLDKPVFKDMASQKFSAFRQLFESEKTILWVTSGRTSDEPWSNIAVGFGRTAVNETPDLHLQHLDIPNPDEADPRVIAETLLRLHYRVREKENALWATEPEIIVDTAGRQLVPRLRPLTTPNSRYNSARRPIAKSADIKATPVAINRDENKVVVERLESSNAGGDHDTQTIELEVTHAVFSALKTPLGHQFLALGKEKGTGNSYIALLSSITSAARVTLARAVRSDLNVPEQTQLSLLAAHITALTIVEPLCTGQTVVLHNSPTIIADAVGKHAASKGIQVVYTADSADASSTPKSWIQFAPYASSVEVFQALPADISSFVGLSTAPSDIESAIISGLPDHCHKATTKSLFRDRGYATDVRSCEFFSPFLQKALASVRGAKSLGSAAASLSINKVASPGFILPEDPLSVVTLSSASPVSVHFRRLDTKPMFKGNKTYWLAGLSGVLGISLCDWMIAKGARTLVLSSRNPNIDPSWLESHKQNGANVHIIPCDVTDERALRAVHKTIVSTLPPIAGALNGAMVLRDVTVRKMSYEQLMDVVRPKVLGSIHMDEIFKNDDLDFFILFSSINCIIGNPGQANYAGANTFMCSLAAQRRKRGLAATALNVGAIIGAGYIEREASKALDLTVARGSLMHLSEEDFHQLFAEAIEAGRPGNDDGPEVSTGVLDVAVDAADPPRWISDPKFSHFIIHHKSGDGAEKENDGASSIQDLLRDCQSTEELQAVIEKSFAAELRNELQMTAADDELMGMRSNELGLDSLISVDIRTWFLKNFQVSIPVLEILGNKTMRNLAQTALENMPPELAPGIGSSAGSEPEARTSKPSDTPTDNSSSNGDESSNMATEPPTPVTPVTPGERNKIDWNHESALTVDLDTIASNPTNSVQVNFPPKVIVLTGVSGLLGHHLRDYLLENTAAEKVICIAVRQLARRVQRKELPQSSRVTYYEGDLSLPRLGLSEADARTIFDKADAVIHNGADTSHLKYFAAVQASNVGSTRELVRLALPRRIPIHYVSSVGAGLFAVTDVLRPVSAADSSPPEDGSHGYMASKWTSERFLERVSERYGLGVWVHRPSTIVRSGRDAEGAKAQLDWVNALLQYIRVMRAAPKVQHIRGALDLVYVRSVCEDLVRHMLGGPRPDGAVTYVHEVGDVVLPLDRLHKIGGSSAEVIPMADWIQEAVASGLHPGVAALIEAMDTAGTPDYPSLQKGST